MQFLDVYQDRSKSSEYVTKENRQTKSPHSAQNNLK